MVDNSTIEGKDSNENVSTEPTTGYEAYQAYRDKLDGIASAENKQGDINIDEGTDGTILANVLQTPISDESTDESTSVDGGSGVPAKGEEASKASTEDAGPDRKEGETESGDSTEPDKDNNATPEGEPSSGTDSESLSKSAKRYKGVNDRLRNAINATKFLEEAAEKRIRENAVGLLSEENVIEYIKKNKKAPELLDEFTVEDLTGIYNPTSMLHEGGRVNEATGDRFTEEEAKYFIAKRKELNKQRQEKFNEELKDQSTRVIANSEAEIKQLATKAKDDHLAACAVLDSYPELDLENKNLPEPIRALANAFWKEVAEKYSDQLLGTDFLKDNFNLDKAAKDFLEVNKAYIEANSKTPAQGKQESKEPEADKGAIAPSGASSAPSSEEPKDKEELEFDALINKQREKLKKSVAQATREKKPLRYI